LAFLAPLFSFSALIFEAKFDLLSLLVTLFPAFLLAIAALMAYYLSSSVNSLAGSSYFAYSDCLAAAAFFFSFFFLFFELPSPTFGASAYLDSSFGASVTATPAIKASNSASSFALSSFLVNFLAGFSIK
jgi:hypothetical protein